MTVTLWLPPLVKALTTAFLVVSASVAAEALGPFWGALITSLPLSAGPAYVFLAMRHTDAFLAATALGSLVANASSAAFLTTYGLLATRTRPASTLAIATLAWFATTLATQQRIWSPGAAALLNLAAYNAGLVLLNGIQLRQIAGQPAITRKWFELPARAVAVAAFVSAVVTASSLLGPNATGIAAVFPVSFISLFAIIRPRLGAAAASRLAANALKAMIGFGLMLLVLRQTIQPYGAPTALTIALMVSMAWSTALLLQATSNRKGVITQYPDESTRRNGETKR